MLRNKSCSVAQRSLFCCATKPPALRKATEEGAGTSSTTRGAHLFVEKCAPLKKEVRTSLF